MRPNRYIILISILLGVVGSWLTVDAVGQYLNMARSFASVNAHYIEDSFTWQDPEHQRSTAEFTVVNNSDNDAVLDYLSMNLYFDDRFAGARYDQWDPVAVPAGESVDIEVSFLTSITEQRPRGSEAEISVRGQLRLNFEGIERDMTVRTSGNLGQVPYEEQD